MWRLHVEDHAVWACVLKSIHGSDGILKSASIGHQQSNWKNIVNYLDRMRNIGTDIRESITKKCGDGKDSSFWKDPWMQNQPFKDKFPRLYALETDKSVSVAGRLGDANRRWNWIREPARGCTGDNLMELEEMISNVQLTNEKDK